MWATTAAAINRGGPRGLCRAVKHSRVLHQTEAQVCYLSEGTTLRGGPGRTTFCTPHPYSPLSPQASVQLQASLELVAMEGEEPLSPRSLAFSTSS